MKPVIRPATSKDSKAICAIYNEHVLGTVVTFEEDVVGIEAMKKRVERVSETFPWLVVEHEGEVVGYAYATTWRERVAYRHTVETAIYIDPKAQGKGLGEALYRALIDELQQSDCDFHCALAGIALPNPESVSLHEKLGFKKVAEFPEVGRKFDRWIDVGFWQLDL